VGTTNSGNSSDDNDDDDDDGGDDDDDAGNVKKSVHFYGSTGSFSRAIFHVEKTVFIFTPSPT